jgi:hypothetical protein
VKRTLAVIAALAIAALIPSAALASQGVASKKPPKPPAVGHWTVNHTATTVVEAAGGGFTVTHRHADVTKLSVKIGPGAETASGIGTISVIGKHRLYDAKGTSEFGSYNEWVVGRNEPNDDPVIQPEKVTLGRAGKHFHGRLDIVFSKPRGGVTSGGDIVFNTKKFGGCDLSFGIKKS